MRARHLLCGAAALAVATLAEPAVAAEYGFTIYPLGSLAFDAGATPPPGLYITPNVGYFQGNIAGNVNVGRVIAINADVKILLAGVNVLIVPAMEFLGGHWGFSLNVPGGFMDLTAQAVLGPFTGSREVSGGGGGDIFGRAQLGWTHGTFSHTFYLTAFANTGRYSPTFAPNIGLNRPAVDVTWGFSYLEPSTTLQLNGAFGFTFNRINQATDYQTGNEFHAEWALGKKLGQQWTIGVAGYHYRQLEGDSGSGATLGPFIGRTNGIGPALGYVTQIAGHIAIFNVRHYWEYEVVNRFGGSTTVATATVRF
jgi:hypothetical protein